MFRVNGGVPRCTRPGLGAILRGGVLVRGALMGVLAIGAAARTMLRERRRPLAISAPGSLARVHPSWQCLLLAPGIG